MTELIAEINSNFVDAQKNDLSINGVTIMITPPIGEDYWLIRVKLYKDQSIIGFPKFNTVGIGFAIEDDDWNTNLPFTINSEKIYNHIECNKKYKEITKKNCIEAIELIQKTIIETFPQFKIQSERQKIKNSN